jgi:putative Holliday junction resolvase
LRIIGLDVGDARIGVAATDPIGATAQPIETIRRDELSVEHIRGLSEELGAERIVVGLPLLMDGREGAQAASVRGFAEELERSLGLPVSLVDERLTTKEADSVLRGSKLGGTEKKAASDRLAAALILRAYLEHPEGA